MLSTFPKQLESVGASIPGRTPVHFLQIDGVLGSAGLVVRALRNPLVLVRQALDEADEAPGVRVCLLRAELHHGGFALLGAMLAVHALFRFSERGGRASE